MLPNTKNLLLSWPASTPAHLIKEKRMTNPEAKKSLKQFVVSKIKARDEKLAQTTDLEDQRYVLTDYDLFFKGAAEALETIGPSLGLDSEDQKPVQMAKTANATQLQLLEQRIELEDMLEDDAE